MTWGGPPSVPRGPLGCSLRRLLGMAAVPPSILTQATPAGGPGSAPAVTPNSTFCPTGGGGGGYRPGNDGYGNAHGTPSARPLWAAGGAGGGDLFGLLRGFLTILPLWGLGRRHRLPAPHLPWPSAPRPPAWWEPSAAPTHLRPGARKQQWAVTLSGARAAGTPGIWRGSSCLPNERGRRFGAGGYARRESTYRNHSYPHGICTCILPGPAVRRVSGRLYRLQSDCPSEGSDIQLLCN